MQAQQNFLIGCFRSLCDLMCCDMEDIFCFDIWFPQSDTASKSSKKSRKHDTLKKSRSSLLSEDVFGSDDESYTSEGTVDLPFSRSATPPGKRSSSRQKVDRSGSASSGGSRKSVQELLAEAQDISSPDSVPLHKWVIVVCCLKCAGIHFNGKLNVLLSVTLLCKP